ncbi:unannotated protein [freshwater metagenome]|uniref:Unannotated protein n=1 Tax=freshwater metagenome TaxID=449393 RepID=A0A6J7SJ34_9ZZZZ|nr:hypothetical protein [Actinomycetota bacterium]MTB08615.1 hypothetical protein [Actinomycetota bacterium]
MFETLLLALLIFLFLNRTKRRKKPRGLDAELKELIENSNDATGIGLEIKGFLLDLINDEKNDAEKFSDARLAQAQRIIDRAGPGAMYWMTDIAAQLAFLAAAQINGIPTNVNAELPDSATPEDIVRIVVRP